MIECKNLKKSSVTEKRTRSGNFDFKINRIEKEIKILTSRII